MIEAVTGVIIGLLVIVVSRILSRFFTTKLIAATILVAIAFIDVGFSLNDNPVGLIVLEVCVAANIPNYYPTFCVIVDIIDGLYFLYIFNKQT